MGETGKRSQFRLGFLTAIEVPDKGFVGGLLVTNHFGRPLEFQCTLPVKANPTQEILYGPTLAPFILGELIGGTLVEKAGIKPDLILTDREQILELRNHVSAPVAFVPGAEPGVDPSAPAAARQATHAETAATADAASGDAAVQPTPLTAADIAGRRTSEGQSHKIEMPGADGNLRLGRQVIRFHAAHATDSEVVAREAHDVPQDANLCEPFDRVREALLETLRCGALR